MDPCCSALLVDLYELSMLETYLARGMRGAAVFEFFVRRLPPRRRFLTAAGLEQALEYLENLRFSAEELRWLKATRRFSASFLGALSALRFTGDVDALPEGTPFFAQEPILRVTAPLPEAQLAETRLINILQFQTLVASKAARCVLAAPGRTLVDYGLRRAHGAEAGLLAARASYLAGFAGSSNVLAQARFGVPAHGTMAHSFVQAFASEREAFRSFALSHPREAFFLLDTYDTERAAREVVALAAELKRRGIPVRGVRLDSGDLAGLSRKVRGILDRGGLRNTLLVASGSLDEYRLRDLAARKAPIDVFGVGTSLDVSRDAPALDCAYKLVEYDGRPVWKESAGKATRPWPKQVWRSRGPGGVMRGDVVAPEGARFDGEPLLRPVMRRGRRLPGPSLAAARAAAAREAERLPDDLKRLDPGEDFPVRIVSPPVTGRRRPGSRSPAPRSP